MHIAPKFRSLSRRGEGRISRLYLIAERYEQTATIVTSNLDFAEWGDAFPNRLLGAATLDRLRHGAYRLVLDGDSYRSPRPLPEGPKSPLAKGSKNAKS